MRTGPTRPDSTRGTNVVRYVATPAKCRTPKFSCYASERNDGMAIEFGAPRPG